MAQQYSLGKIRQLLIEGFSDQELRDLVFDMREFKPIYNNLAENTSKTQIARQLADYADRHELIDILLDQAKTRNPAKYEEFQPYVDDMEIFAPNPADKEPEADHTDHMPSYEGFFKTLTTYFSEGELKDLASYLNADYEELAGEDEQEKARALILYCQQNELIDILKQGIERAPKGIYFVSRSSDNQSKRTDNTSSSTIPTSWPTEIRCKGCGRLIRLVDLDEHLSNGIELSSEEYDFISEKEELEHSGNWTVTGFIVCRSCGRKNPLVERYINTYVQNNYTCSNCKQAGYMTAYIDKIEGWPGTNFVRRISFSLICENCDQRGVRRKLLRSFQNVKSLLISNKGVRVMRTPRTAKGE
jgi:hypothetical protein